MCEFGCTIRGRDFYFNESHSYINHGAYGAVPKPVHETRLRLMAELENNPDVWFRWTSKRKWSESRQAVADFVGAHVDNVVLVNNATTGCNAVIKSLPLEPGESILINTYTYNAVVNASKSAMSKSGGNVVTVDLPLSLDKDTLLKLYREKLESHPKVKLVVLDFISSYSAILFPMKEIIALCKEYGKLVLVDGAHAPGHVPLNLEELDADFFTGNFHKWGYTPRGCAVLWVHPKYHDVIKPSMTSHGYKSGSLQGDFFFQGTSDNTQYFSVARAIKYHEDIGGLDKISSYCTSLLDEAVAMLTRAWGTETFPIPRDMEAPFMRLVEMPRLNQVKRESQALVSTLTSLMQLLSSKYDVTTMCFQIHGRNWIRLSANVYNNMADYERLREAILDLQRQEVDNVDL